MAKAIISTKIKTDPEPIQKRAIAYEQGELLVWDRTEELALRTEKHIIRFPKNGKTYAMLLTDSYDLFIPAPSDASIDIRVV